MSEAAWPQIAEEHFRQAQMSHNPNAITGLLQHHPYHIGTLLACSDLYRYFTQGPDLNSILCLLYRGCMKGRTHASQLQAVA